MTDFSRTRAMFQLPPGVTYLDGNSLGPLPTLAIEAVNRTLREEWGQSLIRAWNAHGWMEKPRIVGDRIGRLINAAPGSNSLVITAPTASMALIETLIDQLDQIPNAETQIKVFQILNGDAQTLLTMLQTLFASTQQAGGGQFGGGGIARVTAVILQH
jgi:kynureninase